MRKLINRMTGILCLPVVLLCLGFYSMTKSTTKKEFYSLFSSFVINIIKTGKYERPEAYVKKRIYP